MKQKIFKTSVVEKLENNIIPNKAYYLNMKEKPFWVKEMFEKADNKSYAVSSNVDIDDFELIIGDSKSDKENAKIVYSHLKSLSPVQAVSSELWTYMTHIRYAKYMANRWRINDNENEGKLKTVIKERYFAIRGSKGIVRNGIARLWWAGYWGYDPDREDPYELIDVIFDMQETYEHISERSFNRNKNILIASLEAIKKYEFDSKKVRALYTKINSYGSDRILDALNIEEARKMVEELVEEINEQKAK